MYIIPLLPCPKKNSRQTPTPTTHSNTTILPRQSPQPSGKKITKNSKIRLQGAIPVPLPSWHETQIFSKLPIPIPLPLTHTLFLFPHPYSSTHSSIHPFTHSYPRPYPRPHPRPPHLPFSLPSFLPTFLLSISIPPHPLIHKSAYPLFLPKVTSSCSEPRSTPSLHP